MVKVSNDEFMFVGSLLSDQIDIYENIVCIQERYNMVVSL